MDVSLPFRDIDVFMYLQNSLFFPPHPCLTTPSGGTPCNINVIYTLLKNTFNGLNFCHWHWVYLHSFSGCWLPKSRNHAKFRQNLTLQQFKIIQGLGVDRKRMAYVTSYISH